MALTHFGQDQFPTDHENDLALGNEQGGVACCGTKNASPFKPGLLRMDSSTTLSGTAGTYYLWVSATGALRIHTAIPTADTDGALV